MPTKKRAELERERELQKRQTQEEQDALFAHPPDNMTDALFGRGNIPHKSDDDGCPDPVCKLGHGLVSGDEFGNIFPNSDAIGSRKDTANDYRKVAAQRYAEQLKKDHPEAWERRGGADWIAKQETKAGRPIHIDSVRRIIKRYKLRQASTSP